MYTIQSLKNNQYIGSLFSDGHAETFNERDATMAYAWSSQSQCQKIADEFGECKIVEISFQK